MNLVPDKLEIIAENKMLLTAALNTPFSGRLDLAKELGGAFVQSFKDLGSGEQWSKHPLLNAINACVVDSNNENILSHQVKPFQQQQKGWALESLQQNPR